jgi:CheY-like chemotaxis protein
MSEAGDVRLLLVDDEPDARALLRSTLEVLGHEVVGVVEDGASACAGVADLRPDVVVMDWQMPSMDGIAATRCLVERAPGIVVIGCTASPDGDVRDRFLSAGAAACVRKGDLAGLEGALAAAAESLRPSG